MGFDFKKFGNILGKGMTVFGAVISFAPGMQWLGVGLIIAGGTLQAITADAWEKKPDSPAMSGHLMNVTSSRQPLKLIYGKCEVGVNKTFYHLNNPYMHIIAEIGEGPLYGIEREDGSYYTTTATELPSSNPPLIYFDENIWTDYGTSNVYMEWFDGSATQTICSTLETASGGKWDQTLRRTSYLYVRLQYNPDKFKKEPEITLKLKGLEVYDPVADATDWTENPALCVYDNLTRSSQLGGVGVSASKINLTALEAARDYCDAKGWVCGLPIGEQRPASDNLEQLLGCFRGIIIYSEAEYKILFMDYNYESVVMAFDDSEVVDGTLRIGMADTGERYNAIRCTYLDASKHYKPNDFVYSSDTDVTADGDYRELAVALYGLNESSLVQKMAVYLLERNRLRKTVTLSVSERGKALEPNDLITLTHDMPGWEDKLLRVQAATILPDGTVALSCLDDAETLYDDTYNLTEQDYHDTTLLDPNAAPPEVTSVTITETVYEFRLRSQSRLDIAFDAPANYPWFDYVEVWISRDDTNWTHQFNAKEDFSIDPAEEGVTYYVKLVTVNVFGTAIEFSSAPKYSKFVDGKSDDAPSSLNGLQAIITGTALNLYSDKLGDSDIEVYEFRLGASWSGAVFLAAMRSPNLSLNGVKPGSHTIWANSLGSNGLYGETPVSVSVVMPEPPRGWTLISTFVGTTAGVCTDSTVYLYNSSNYIKVNHSSALTGSWDSTIYDNSSSKQVLAYITADMTVIGAGSLWSDLIPTTETLWEEVVTTSRTWAEAFAPEAAPQVSMKLNYGDSTELGSTLERLEILSGIVTGRYFKSVITITDPQPNIYGIVQLPTIKLAT